MYRESHVGNVVEGTWKADPISALYGGTGFSSYADGDLLVGVSPDMLGQLPIGSPGDVLTVVAGFPAWAAPGGGGPSPANPTASVGLAAVNGSVSTYMRSDAAPALDQGIVPTWTGAHHFNEKVSLGAAVPGNVALNIAYPTSLGLTGASQAGISNFIAFDATVATTVIRGMYTALEVNGAGAVGEVNQQYMINPSLGGGATIGTLYGYRVTDLTAGGVNYAFHSGLGQVFHGDTMQVNKNVGLGDAFSGRTGLNINYPKTIFSVSGNNRMVTIAGTFNAAVADTSARFLDVEGSIDGAATVPTSYGAKIGDVTLSGGAAVTNQIGLRIDNQTVGTNKWAIQTGTGLVDFGDEMRLSASNTVNASVLAVVTNKIKLNVGGTDYFLLASTSNA